MQTLSFPKIILHMHFKDWLVYFLAVYIGTVNTLMSRHNLEQLIHVNLKSAINLTLSYRFHATQMPSNASCARKPIGAKLLFEIIFTLYLSVCCSSRAASLGLKSLIRSGFV